MQTKEEFILKAEAILKQGDLSSADMALWQGVFKDTSPAAISLFIDIMQDDATLLPFLTENLKKKIDAGADPDKINKIVEDERVQFQELAQS
jgi:hypothetical protein